MIYISFDDFFAILGNKQRVRILQYLNMEGPKRVSDISNKLKIEQSAVSHNLKQLRLCHFVQVERQGKERIYAINGRTIRPLFNLIKRHIKTYDIKKSKHWE